MGGKVDEAEEDEPLSSPPVIVKAPRSGSRLRVRDDQLDSLLRLAGGCLRSGRPPGEPRVRDLLARFEAEAEAARALQELEEEAEEEKVQKKESSTLPQVTTPRAQQTRSSAEADRPMDLISLRREVAELVRGNNERRTELQEAKGQLAKQVLEHSNAREKLESLEAEVKRVSKELKLAKMHSSRHEAEALELHEALEKAAQRPASVPSSSSQRMPRAPSGSRPERQSARSGSSSGYRRARQNSRTASSAGKPVGPGDSCADRSASDFGGGMEDSFGQTAFPVEELRNVLLADQEELPPAEAALWDHLRSENDKLVSVIDAVGELSQQLSVSEQRPPDPQRRGGVTPPPVKHWTYSSVLSQGYQKYRKLYI